MLFLLDWEKGEGYDLLYFFFDTLILIFDEAESKHLNFLDIC